MKKEDLQGQIIISNEIKVINEDEYKKFIESICNVKMLNFLHKNSKILFTCDESMKLEIGVLKTIQKMLILDEILLIRVYDVNTYIENGGGQCDLMYKISNVNISKISPKYNVSRERSLL